MKFRFWLEIDLFFELENRINKDHAMMCHFCCIRITNLEIEIRHNTDGGNGGLIGSGSAHVQSSGWCAIISLKRNASDALGKGIEVPKDDRMDSTNVENCRIVYLSLAQDHPTELTKRRSQEMYRVYLSSRMNLPWKSAIDAQVGCLRLNTDH